MDGVIVFVGSALKPAFEVAIGHFKRLGGPPVQAIYGGSGRMLEQMILRRAGDLYLPSTQDFLGVAIERGVIRPVGQRVLAIMTPCLVTQMGNPLGIRGLEDLTKPGRRVAIGNPHHAGSGLFAQGLLARANLLERVRPNVIAYPESCEGMLMALLRDQVDVIVGWTAFDHWAIAHARLQILPLMPAQLVKARCLIAPTIFSREPQAAEYFTQFLASPEGRRIFVETGYELPPVVR